jgi:hypothetical protein
MPGSIGPAAVNIFEITYPAGSTTPFLQSKVCLLPMVDRSTWDYFRLHQHYRNSILLTAGGIMDQPNIYIEVMEQITEAMNHG